MEDQVRLGKYAFRFAAIYLLLLVGMAIVLSILEIDSNSGATMGALMGSAMATAIKFVQDNKRPPTKSEKNRLALISLLASWIVSLLLMSILLLAGSPGAEILESIKSVNLMIIITIVVVLSLIYFLVLSFSYGYLAKKQYEAMLKQGKI
ncbi:ABZJ_00895 family protein [Microbulbifer sp. JMSA003]|uniref:ABZJ_00895 family protein n=1 Tax=Microbulbifer sp. JMSA003 TaxID=3243369 RepID=UPI00403977CC